ncbi:MAG: chorismate synthase [Deltaproteobacteria bacterium]|nr:chorismate synthase [Deltaproteobacteria bacterium]
MAGSTFGSEFRVTTAGESHGPANVVIVDGCPAGLRIDEELVAADLRRRRPGGAIASARAEPDYPEILSGIYEGRTTGAPIAILIRNLDARPADYAALAGVLRPGHGDFGWVEKFGFRDPRGGGRASARETVARVAAGAIARRLVETWVGARIYGFVTQVGDACANVSLPEQLTRASIDFFDDGSVNEVRCPDPVAASKMRELIEQVRSEGDSIGGVAEVWAVGVPAGLGEPVFDKLKADLAKALFSVPAVVGVELGDGFALARARGSASNDPFVSEGGAIRTETNRHGGVLGGISSGMPIRLRVAVKPPSSIRLTQSTVNEAGEPVELSVRGRHDPCLLPRFVPVAEAMVALVIADHLLRSGMGARGGS